MTEHIKAPEKRHAQTILANELTSLIHGEDELQDAISQSKALFGTKITSEFIAQMTLSDFESHFENY
jgi:tyrosyl-tRNA synthetase